MENHHSQYITNTRYLNSSMLEILYHALLMACMQRVASEHRDLIGALYKFADADSLP